MIVDEVQTCIGRTGTMFACDHDGVAPDIMTLAKQLGGGVMPIGATMGTAAVWEKVFSENPLMHTSTFGGNPLACAAGLAAVRVVQDEDLVARSRDRGALMLELPAGDADQALGPRRRRARQGPHDRRGVRDATRSPS